MLVKIKQYLFSNFVTENDTDETESFEVINEEVYNDVAIVTEQDFVDIDQEWQTRSDITIWDNLENSGQKYKCVNGSNLPYYLTNCIQIHKRKRSNWTLNSKYKLYKLILLRVKNSLFRMCRSLGLLLYQENIKPGIFDAPERCNLAILYCKSSAIFISVAGESETPLKDSTMNLAVKMMFNYDTDSDSDTILRAMQNETVPCQMFADVQSRPKFENGYVEFKYTYIISELKRLD